MNSYFEDVAVEAEQVEEPIGVHLLHVEAVDHENGAFLRAVRGVGHPSRTSTLAGRTRLTGEPLARNSTDRPRSLKSSPADCATGTTFVVIESRRCDVTSLPGGAEPVLVLPLCGPVIVRRSSYTANIYKGNKSILATVC